MYNPSAVWSCQIVTTDTKAPVTLSSSSPSSKSFKKINSSVVEFAWNLTNYPLTVSIHASIQNNNQLVLVPTFSSNNNQLGLWRWTLHSTGTTNLTASASNLEMNGFGRVHRPPASFSGIYPSYTSQFVALWDDHGGTYTATHDAEAHSKGFGCEVQPGVTGRTSSCYVQVTPPNAGLPLSQYTSAFPVVVTTFLGDWFDAAAVYKKWVLHHARWTEQGPLSSRTDRPMWVDNMTTWINSHWQGNDIFNITGGDPMVVLNRVKAIVHRFNLKKGELGLHWYEWDTLGYELGSNYSKCENEITCGFDTHYPEYFPVRVGFNDTLKILQELGVKVAPYVNGRIFDTGTKSWKENNMQGKRASAKFAAPFLGGDKNLTGYIESYGSKVDFALMCPNATFWQEEMAKVVGTLAEGYDTDGVYIDQIAAAAPKPWYVLAFFDWTS